MLSAIVTAWRLNGEFRGQTTRTLNLDEAMEAAEVPAWSVGVLGDAPTTNRTGIKPCFSQSLRSAWSRAPEVVLRVARVFSAPRADAATHSLPASYDFRSCQAALPKTCFSSDCAPG